MGSKAHTATRRGVSGSGSNDHLVERGYGGIVTPPLLVRRMDKDRQARIGRGYGGDRIAKVIW